MAILDYWSEHVRYVFGMAEYNEYPNDELAIEAFIHHRGGLEIESLAWAFRRA